MREVNICDHGECGGECYKCRLAEVERRAVTAEASDEAQISAEVV